MVQASLRAASLPEAHHDTADVATAIVALGIPWGVESASTQFDPPRGNTTSNFAPPEVPSETMIFPPFRSTNFLARGKPMPVPSGLVVKNGSKTRSLLSTGMPSPGIFDGNMNVGGGSVVLKSICPDSYATPIGCGLQCIGNQPHENLFHMIGIQLHLGKAPV